MDKMWLLGVGALSVVCMVGLNCSFAKASTKPLKPFKRISLMVHALNWLELTQDNPLRKTSQWEQWPDRCKKRYQYEFGLKEKHYALMSKHEPDTGAFVLPSGMKGDPPLIEVAKRTYGDAVVEDTINAPKELGAEFMIGLADDIKRAESLREELSEEELGAWAIHCAPQHPERPAKTNSSIPS